jgi:hypothetical protein
MNDVCIVLRKLRENMFTPNCSAHFVLVCLVCKFLKFGINRFQTDGGDLP